MKSYHPVTIPFHSGWLEKKSKWLASWRKRWVYLNGFDLYTFKDLEGVYSYHGIPPDRRRYFHDNIRHKATEIINLSIETNPIIITGNIARPFSFQIILNPHNNTNDKRIISFVATSQDEFNEWINKLQTAINIVNDNKLLITKIFRKRDTSNMHCFIATQKQNIFHCDIDANNIINDVINNIRQSYLNQTELKRVYELSIFDIQYLCFGYIRDLYTESKSFSCPCGIINEIQKYVRFELNVCNENVNIIGGTQYEYISINITNNGIVNFLLNSTIKCLYDCIIVNNSMLCFSEGITKLNVMNHLHINNKSAIKHFKYTNNNCLDVVCGNDIIINTSTITTKDLNITVSKTFTMNLSAFVTKCVIINVLIDNLNIIDSNIRADNNIKFNLKTGSILCDKTGIICNNGMILFDAPNGLIKINGNENIHSNIYAFENIKINGYKFILNTSNKETIFHPYLESNKGKIEINTKPNLCKFNVFTWPQSKQIIENYYWDKFQPVTWLTKPIPIFNNNNIPKIFKHKYLYPFELSIKQIEYLIAYQVRHNIKQLDSNLIIKCISSYLRFDLIFGFNNESLKTLYFKSNEIYEYYNIKINKGYKIKVIKEDINHIENRVLNINCLNDMDIGGAIMLNQIVFHENKNINDMKNVNYKNIININVGKEIIMRKNSNIAINYYGPFDQWKYLLITQNANNNRNDDNCNDNYTEYYGGDININCKNLIMEENCSIDSIGYNGGNINIKSNKNIDMCYAENRLGNVICSIATSLNNGNGGNIIIECNELNISNNTKGLDSKIQSIGKCQNGEVIVKAKIIKGQISNIKPDTHLTDYPSKVILY